MVQREQDLNCFMEQNSSMDLLSKEFNKFKVLKKLTDSSIINSAKSVLQFKYMKVQGCQWFPRFKWFMGSNEQRGQIIQGIKWFKGSTTFKCLNSQGFKSNGLVVQFVYHLICTQSLCEFNYLFCCSKLIWLAQFYLSLDQLNPACF